MASFKYKARDARGELITGVLNAANVEEAGRLLRALTVVDAWRRSARVHALAAAGCDPRVLHSGRSVCAAELESPTSAPAGHPSRDFECGWVSKTV